MIAAVVAGAAAAAAAQNPDLDAFGLGVDVGHPVAADTAALAAARQAPQLALQGGDGTLVMDLQNRMEAILKSIKTHLRMSRGCAIYLYLQPDTSQRK